MTLIKLDSGAEIVVEHVDAFHAASDSTAGHPKRVVVVSGIDYRITEADHDRIVEAMIGDHTPNRMVLGEVYGALEVVNQGMKDGAYYGDIDGLLHVFKMAVNGEAFND